MHKSVKNGQLKKRASYGRIKTSTIGGILYGQRISTHTRIRKRNIGTTLTRKNEDGKFARSSAFSKKQYTNFITRYNRRQDKIAAGIALKKKGRPAKDSNVTEEDKVSDLRYKLARKDARIKQLEMENELMRDFLSLAERK